MKRSLNSAIQSALWSAALPGLGQLLNRKYLKGLLFVILEFIINVGANLNNVIILSFHGNIDKAIEQANFRWLLFYPCVYMFAIWDAYKDATEDDSTYLYIPFVLSAYIGTIAVIFSPTFELMGVKIGPIFLPIITITLVLALGITIIKALSR